MKLVTVTTALLVLGSAAALAQTNTPVIDQKQANQAQRIEAGKASGALNDKEAARFQKVQARVQDMKANAAADGRTTQAERDKIKETQKIQSKRIAKQKHDAHTK